MALGGGQVSSLEEASAKGDGFGVGTAGILDVEVEVDLLCIAVGPLGRIVVGCELHADHPSPLGVEDDDTTHDLHAHIIAPGRGQSQVTVTRSKSTVTSPSGVVVVCPTEVTLRLLPGPAAFSCAFKVKVTTC